MTIRITRDGTIEFIYEDRLRPLLEQGEAKVERASHVEPTKDARWQADLSPIGGTLLESTETREASLRAEVNWIERHRLQTHPEQGQDMRKDEHEVGTPNHP